RQRDRVPAAALHRCRDSHPERRQGAQAARLRREGRSRRGARADDRVVQGAQAGTGLIRLGWPDVGPEELAAVAEVLESGFLTMGPKVDEFERGIAAACGIADAVAVSSGTAALHLALLALGVGEGDEVIVPAYTFPATANAVVLAGARPVLVDVDPVTMNVDHERIAAVVSPRTRALLAVHLFGRPLDWAAVEDAVPSSVALVEDA